MVRVQTIVIWALKNTTNAVYIHVLVNVNIKVFDCLLPSTYLYKVGLDSGV